MKKPDIVSQAMEVISVVEEKFFARVDPMQRVDLGVQCQPQVGIPPSSAVGMVDEPERVVFITTRPPPPPLLLLLAVPCARIIVCMLARRFT